MGWDKRSAAILTNICCHNGELPQGAPTGPGLSNAVNMLMDARLDALAKTFKGDYSIFSINRGQDLTNFISTLFYTSIIRKICQVSPEY